MTRKRSTIAEIRHTEYESAKILGDIEAIQHHRVGKRIHNRIIGHFTGQMLGRLMK